MTQISNTSKSLDEVNSTVDTMGKGSLWKRILAFFGPAYLVAVGYMDPGNWATDIEGGSRYGYALIWVLVMSNIMAIILQTLSARLGIVYKKDLAQVNRETYPPVINFCLYILAELAIAACDLAEIIGMAIGLNLLFGLPMIWGVTITILDTFLLLYLQKLGIRKMEAFIISLILIIAVSFCFELFFVKPVISEILLGIRPSLPDDYALYIAIGIIGATVMPHNLYLHSALVQTRNIGEDDDSKRKAIKWNFVDSIVALNLALFVNAAILILAASAFHNNGMTEISSIEDAHKLLEPLVGNQWASMLFAIALIAAGQSSTVTGTLAGQIVMEGYLHIRINPWLRRILTRVIAIVPAFITILIAGADKMTDLLIFSQVVLSVQLSFAVIPLVYSVSNKRIMGNFVIKPWLIIVSIVVTAIILYLNISMVLNKALKYLNETDSMYGKISVITSLILFTIILLITIIYPLLSKKMRQKDTNIHNKYPELNPPESINYLRVALSLDFSDLDGKIISHGLKQAGIETTFVLIHIVESASAKYLGINVADAETAKDEAQLKLYQSQLMSIEKHSKVCLGFGDRVNEIARICKEEKVDLIIMGAHGHKGFMDFVYGQTIESVRHKVDVPVLIVS